MSGWTNEKTIELIYLYKSKNFLWNPNAKHYRKKSERMLAFKEIGDMLGYPAEEIEKKIHILRKQFQRECKKIDKPSSWFAYPHLKFLTSIDNNSRVAENTFRGFGKIGKEEKEDSLIEEESVSVNSEYDSLNSALELNSNITTYHIELVNEGEEGVYVPEESTKALAIEMRDIDTNRHKGTQSYAQKTLPIAESQISDNLEVFGKYVAEELKNIIDDAYSIQVAKHKINQVLFEATTGSLANSQ